jgi:hypothetical protein
LGRKKQQDVSRAEKNWAYLDLAEEKKGRGRRTILTDLGKEDLRSSFLLLDLGGALRFFAQWRLCLIGQVGGGGVGEEGKDSMLEVGSSGVGADNVASRAFYRGFAIVVVPLSFLGKFRAGGPSAVCFRKDSV